MYVYSFLRVMGQNDSPEAPEAFRPSTPRPFRSLGLRLVVLLSLSQACKDLNGSNMIQMALEWGLLAAARAFRLSFQAK